MGIQPLWDANWDRLNRAIVKGPAMLAVAVVLISFSVIAGYTGEANVVWYGPCAALGLFLIGYRFWNSQKHDEKPLVICDGTLIRAINTWVFYLMLDGKKCHITPRKVLDDGKPKEQEEMVLPVDYVRAIPEGNPINSAEKLHKLMLDN